MSEFEDGLFDPLINHDQVLRGLELRAVIQLARGLPASAAAVLQVAVSFAARNHPGWFISPTIERAIAEIGELLDTDFVEADGSETGDFETEPLSASRPDGCVVHVLAGPASELMSEGRCWWEADPTSRIVPLPDVALDILGAASCLRADFAGASLVVLHGPGIALVPLIALAGWKDRPPVVAIEAARTAFWSGIAATDLVIHPSNAAMALGVERRCLPPERGVLVERHERQSSNDLQGVLHQCADRARQLGHPRVPDALLPARPAAIDRWALAQQVESGLADGLSAAIQRWPLPHELRLQPGWVVLAREATATMSTLHSLLDRLPGDYPDIVIVNTDNSSEIEAIEEDLAGVAMVVGAGSILDDFEAEQFGRRHMIMDRVLIVSDGLTIEETLPEDEFSLASVDSDVLARLHAELDDGDSGQATFVEVPTGEVFKLVANHQHGPGVGQVISLDGTLVREDVEITEKHDELFHTELNVRRGAPVETGRGD